MLRERETAREREMKRAKEQEYVRVEKKRGWEGERERERRARASCRHLGLAFNLRASRRALIRAGSSSRYEPGLRYKQELEWVRRSGGGRRGYV